MLKVGKYENVKFSAKKNDKNTLVITASVVEDEFDLNATGDESGEQSQNFMLFPFKMEGYEDGGLVPSRSPSLVLTDIKDTKGLLEFLLALYMPASEIEWDLYEGTGVTMENQKTALFNDETLTLVYNNLVDQFLAQLAQVQNPEKLFRAVFPRTSKKSHFPKLRNKYLSTQPFAEPMDIPEEQSKVGFTDGEIKAGLDSAEQVIPTQSKEDKDLSTTLDV